MRARLFIAVAGLAIAGQAYANAPQNITPGELSRLPEYCPDAQLFETRGMPDNPTPRQRRWVGAMGPTFWAIHHLCWAVLNSNRADYPGVTPQQREHLLSTAIGDSMYVLNNSTPDFPLMPELFARMGQYNQRLGRFGLALEEFEKSRLSKPDYWPAYVGLAEVNVALGRRQMALDAVNTGLRQIPGEPRLTALLEKINQTAAAPPAGTKPRQQAAKSGTQAGAKPSIKPSDKPTAKP